ncbi:hypothetical protein HY640_00580 [Candidatus Woesearchaeota archaeon]|nr:hypothetical protein [Candidatus Woesearchaeota archaeon]
MLEQALRSVLSGNESKVYVDLLKFGPSMASDVAGRTHVNRSDAYEQLQRLIRKGLVGFVVKSNRRYFKASPPSSLLSFIRIERERFDEREAGIRRVIPELNAVSRLSASCPEVSVYIDKDGIRNILEDILSTLKKGDVLLAYGSDEEFYGVLTFYYPHFIRRRVKAGIRLRCVLSSEKKVKLPLSEIRFKRGSYLPVGTVIYGDKVAIFLLMGTPTGILIESEHVADGFRLFFDWLWSASRS